MHIPETFEEKGGFLNNQAQTQAQRGVSRAACELVLACFSKAPDDRGPHPSSAGLATAPDSSFFAEELNVEDEVGLVGPVRVAVDILEALELAFAVTDGSSTRQLLGWDCPVFLKALDLSPSSRSSRGQQDRRSRARERCNDALCREREA